MRLYEFTGLTTEEILSELDRRGFLKGLGAAAATAAVPGIARAASNKENPALDKEIERTKEIFSKLTEFDRRIRRYEYDSKSKTLVIYGAWPRGPGYDGNSVAKSWTIEFDPRLVRFVQLWSLDGKIKFGSSINNSKNRF